MVAGPWRYPVSGPLLFHALLPVTHKTGEHGEPPLPHAPATTILCFTEWDKRLNSLRL